MPITYRQDITPSAEAIISLYDDAGLNRPTHDPTRIAKMYAHSTLIITAWAEDRLVGVARSLTDFSYACYLSDLAVKADYQGKGIGKELIAKTKEAIGPQSMLLLLSAPNAMSYYPHIGFVQLDNAFLIKREE